MIKLVLGYYYHVPALVRSDGIYMPGYQALFIDELARRCKEVICFLYAPAAGETALMDTRIQAGNVRVECLGTHPRAIYQILNSRRTVHRISRHFAQTDILLLRGPSPMLPEFVRQAKGTARALLLVGDYSEGVSQSPGSLIRRACIYLWAKINRFRQDEASAKALTFVNNRQLFNALKNKAARLKEIRTSTIRRDDFFLRSDTCQNAVIRILYAGRIDLAKGLEDIVDAVRILVDRGKNVELDFVGPDHPENPVWDVLRKRSEQRGLGGRVKYHGSRPAGNELLSFYRRADIFVMASRLSFEGFPRTLWEAMASSLPVVSTPVGSIPDYASGSVAFAEIKNPESLAAAILSIMRDPEKRREMICSGRLLAEKSLLDVQVEAMVHEMERWVSEYDKKN